MPKSRKKGTTPSNSPTSPQVSKPKKSPKQDHVGSGVVVTGFFRRVPRKILMSWFSGFGEILRLRFNAENLSALVVYRNHEAARALLSTDITYQGMPLTTEPYVHVTWKMPEPLVEPPWLHDRILGALSTTSDIDAQFFLVLEHIQPSVEECVEKAAAVFVDVMQAVCTKFPYLGPPQPFGSAVTGLCTFWGDLDLSMSVDMEKCPLILHEISWKNMFPHPASSGERGSTNSIVGEQSSAESRTIPEKETLEKETSVKETSVKETSVKETLEKETSVKETSVKETSVKETPEKETSEKQPHFRRRLRARHFFSREQSSTSSSFDEQRSTTGSVGEQSLRKSCPNAENQPTGARSAEVASNGDRSNAAAVRSEQQPGGGSPAYKRHAESSNEAVHAQSGRTDLPPPADVTSSLSNFSGTVSNKPTPVPPRKDAAVPVSFWQPVSLTAQKACHKLLSVKVANELVHNPKFGCVFPIKAARIPIVKFIHIPTNTHCDISFGNEIALSNTALLSYYVNLDARVRPLLVVIKYWAKRNQLTGMQKLSSYALNLLAVCYLQQLQPPVLPSVQTLMSMTSERKISEGWEVAFDNDVSHWKPPTGRNTSNMASLLQGFFGTYANFDFQRNVICPRLGSFMPREAFANPDRMPDAFCEYREKLKLGKANPLPITSDICVQDPFNLSFNCTMHSSAQLLQAFTYHCIVATNGFKQTPQHDFLRTLLSHKLCNRFARASCLVMLLRCSQCPAKKPLAIETDRFRRVADFVLNGLERIFKLERLVPEVLDEAPDSTSIKHQKTDGQGSVHDPLCRVTLKYRAYYNVWNERYRFLPKLVSERAEDSMKLEEQVTTRMMESRYPDGARPAEPFLDMSCTAKLLPDTGQLQLTFVEIRGLDVSFSDLMWQVENRACKALGTHVCALHGSVQL